MIKKIFTGAVMAVAIASLPAHAISEKYRQELERSGKTQVEDANEYKPQPTRTYRGFGMVVKRTGDQVTVDGKAAALDEDTPSAKVFSSGLRQVIFYKKGRVSVTEEGRYLGDLK
ncbi:hypothetical protein ACJVQT_23160 [Enterobacter huaxiensis]|uniref:hypothetical protein n=1 Tax=Enterobacter huaxiensis TaxID=2494702 RepID=UPI0021761456|nr:hypothetical protein [Enterobacter huaxiensis]MCS5452478.1 hypothetical protein [Enterobacter huaxiensis]